MTTQPIVIHVHIHLAPAATEAEVAPRRHITAEDIASTDVVRLTADGVGAIKARPPVDPSTTTP